MRIAFAIEHYSPHHGGAERYAWRLSEWLTGQGHAVDVYTRQPPEEGSAPARVHRLDFSAHPRSLKLRRFAAAVRDALRGETYDVVQGFNHAEPCDVLRLGGGVHLAFERFSAMSSSGPLGERLRMLSYGLLPHFRSIRANEVAQFGDPYRRFIAVSERVAKDMADFYPHVKGRIHVIRNGLDLRRCSPEAVKARRAEARRQLGLEDETLACLFVSNNFRLKGLHDLIDVLPAVRQALRCPMRLIVVGRGNPAPFHCRARALGVDDLLGFRGTAPDMLDYYAAADALLHPTYYDACSNVCLEAMASGLPVLTSRNNGASEVMEDGKGSVIIEVPAPREILADAVLRVLDDGFRAAAREEQWARAQKLPIEDNFRQVLALYEQVAASRSGRDEGRGSAKV